MRRLTLLLLASLVVSDAATPCTGIYAFRKGLALAGNNEDFWNPDTKMWFVPAEGERLGRVYFGFGNLFPQGGMNTAGVFFDGFATGRLPIEDSAGRDAFAGSLIDEAMATCRSVDDVKVLFTRYDVSFLETAMLMFGDRHGESIIVEGDRILEKEGRHQVVTNFYQSQSPSSEWTCPRHATAQRMLKKTKKISVALFRDVLEKVSVDGRVSTQYSNVYDLTHGIVHLYHFHDFDHVVTLDLEKELAKGARVVDLPSLFPSSKKFERYRAERQAEIDVKRDARLAADVDRSRFPDLVGTYDLTVGASTAPLTVSNEDGTIFLSSSGANGPKRFELLPEAEDRFFVIDFDGVTGFEFRRNDDGEVTGLDYINVLGHRYSSVRRPTSPNVGR